MSEGCCWLMLRSNFYDIKDASIPESLDYAECRVDGEKATIRFESGALAGREFDIEQTDKGSSEAT